MKKKLTVVTTAVLLSSVIFGATGAYAKDVTVKPGDTISKYASEYNLSVHKIEQLNHLSSDRIYVGQTLHLGDTSTSTRSSESTNHATTYTVQPGDCLSDIATKYNVSVDDIKSWNHLSNDLLQIGQKLQIEGTGATISSLDSSSLSLAEEIVSRAKDYIGTRYVWGGTTPSGFDCSGFVNYVFNREGKSLPSRTSQGLFADGSRVSSLHIGDLVFFATDYSGSASHVGIYVGDDRFISATDSGVMISRLNSGYWGARYIGARSFF